MNKEHKKVDSIIITAAINHGMEFLVAKLPETVRNKIARDLQICEKRKTSKLSFQQLGIKFRVSKTTAWRVCQSCL